MKEIFIKDQLNSIEKQLNAIHVRNANISQRIKDLREHIEKAASHPEPKFKAGQQALWSGKYKYCGVDKLTKQQITTIITEDRHLCQISMDGRTWWILESELRGVGDKVFRDSEEWEIHKFEGNSVYIQRGQTIITVKPENLSFTPPARPAPKFAKGDVTDKGIVVMVNWSAPHGHYHVWTDKEEYGMDESELHAMPEIAVTHVWLWKVENGKPVVREINKDNDYRVWGKEDFDVVMADKDAYAKVCFNTGVVAVLLEYSDGTKERKYCPEIEAINRVMKGWYTLEANEVIENWILDAINHPNWTVESNGVKMRAYRVGLTDVDIEFDGHDTRRFSTVCNCHIITALGFTPENIMPAVLHGKG